jgi:hypothetical protein
MDSVPRCINLLADETAKRQEKRKTENIKLFLLDCDHRPPSRRPAPVSVDSSENRGLRSHEVLQVCNCGQWMGLTEETLVRRSARRHRIYLIVCQCAPKQISKRPAGTSLRVPWAVSWEMGNGRRITGQALFGKQLRVKKAGSEIGSH